MSARESFTLAENVMKPCIEIAAREIHGGTIGCDPSAKNAIVPIPRGANGQLHHSKFSKTCLVLGTTTSYNYFAPPQKYQLVVALRAVMVGSLKETLLANLREVACFEIQLDENTDLNNDFPLYWHAQLIVYVRFPDKERTKVVDQ